MQQGKVYLVGAGPGDYKLISVKGQECIRKAQVLVYDRLADQRLLDWAPPSAEQIYVGKASNRHTMKQEDINQLLVEKAKAGKIVVRLKGGDPFVFGRGGEEALELEKEGLPFEIVPGITSAIAVPAYAGIPVTHRGLATSFAVITGHEDPSKDESSVQWDKLATGVHTLVFLMGVENLPQITSRLIENGRPADTPAAIIRWGTKPRQRVLITTLGQAAQEVQAAGLRPPAIFLVGDTVGLRSQLAWFDNKPLFGQTVLVTRAREQASALTAGLEERGANCIEAPAIRIMPPDSYQPLDQAIGRLADYDWIIFTSTNGVDAFFQRLHTARLDSRALAKAKIAAIGMQTAGYLREQGILADVVPLEFRAEGILEALKGQIVAGMNILIPRAAVARDILPDKLCEQGAQVTVAPAYQTVTADTDGDAVAAQLQSGEIQLVTFTSSSTVTNLLKLLGEGGVALINRAQVACIGPITAATCTEHGIRVDAQADEYTINGMLQAIDQLYAQGGACS